MRDERWVNRFFFAWNDSLFYDPLETHYVPRTDHFLSTLSEGRRAGFARAGIWWSYRHNENLPAQGWKIHISANHRNVDEVAATAIAYLTEHEIDFKIALDLNIFEMLNSKGMSRGSGGKFVTVYPGDEDQFRATLTNLSTIFDGVEGPYILSDYRYKDCKVLYFRYGQFLDRHTIDVMGRQVPHVVNPSGRNIADPRSGVFIVPEWVSWPFPDWTPEALSADAEPLNGRFDVIEAVTFSNSGGIYKAIDLHDSNRVVVLKEARPDTNVNPRQDHEAVGILRREWDFLRLLSSTGKFPRPVAFFQEWEHWFLAEELIEGTDIREILFENNPLVGLQVNTDNSRKFLRIFLKVFDGLACAVESAHAKGVILGDLTAANLLVDPKSHEVRVIDLEACRLMSSTADTAHLEGRVDLFTPGFSRSRRGMRASTPQDDLYGLATTMGYFLFPIAAMSYLREDVFDLYHVHLEALGWPKEVHQLLLDLAGGSISLKEAIDTVRDDERLIDLVHVPASSPPDLDTSALTAIEQGLVDFVRVSADPQRASLFPVDPFAHTTNPLSLGFGASGVLYTLDRCGAPLEPQWTGWLRERLAELDHSECASGFLNGLAGIAWATLGLGHSDHATALMASANDALAGISDYTLYYGLAGVGMTNLRFHTVTGAPEYLDSAKRCAELLEAAAITDDEHTHWVNDFAVEGPLTGLGFGQAGVAMFLLRLSQLTGDMSYQRLGSSALDWEISNAETWQNGSLAFRHEGTLEPYIEVGAAGIAQVLLRYGRHDDAERVLHGLKLNYSILPGYLFGMSGIVETMLDAAHFLQDPAYRTVAHRQFGYVNSVFLFNTPAPASHLEDAGDPLIAVPGEGLLRCTTDLATGSAGVLRVAHRLRCGGSSDLLLDDITA